MRGAFFMSQIIKYSLQKEKYRNLTITLLDGEIRPKTINSPQLSKNSPTKLSFQEHKTDRFTEFGPNTLVKKEMTKLFWALCGYNLPLTLRK
jgi:hypothetical protein